MKIASGIPRAPGLVVMIEVGCLVAMIRDSNDLD